MKENTEHHIHRLLEVKFAFGEEKWITTHEKDKENCPMCLELENLDWIPAGILPKFRQAHSTLGDGNWKAPDSSCQCRKGYRRAKGTLPDWAQDGTLTYEPGIGYVVMSTKATFNSLCKDKVKAILEKYKDCSCK